MTPNDERPVPSTDMLNERMAQVIGQAIPIRYESVSRERVVASMEVDARTHMPAGLLHGGASMVLAESVASVGAAFLCPPGFTARGQEINGNHIRGVRAGLVRATAVPLHVGRMSQVWSIDIRDDAGKLVCISRCTLAVVPLPPGEPSLV